MIRDKYERIDPVTRTKIVEMINARETVRTISRKLKVSISTIYYVKGSEGLVDTEYRERRKEKSRTDDAVMVEALRNGEPISSIAGRLGISPSRVYLAKLRAGMTRPKAARIAINRTHVETPAASYLSEAEEILPPVRVEMPFAPPMPKADYPSNDAIALALAASHVRLDEKFMLCVGVTRARTLAFLALRDEWPNADKLKLAMAVGATDAYGLRAIFNFLKTLSQDDIVTIRRAIQTASKPKNLPSYEAPPYDLGDPPPGRSALDKRIVVDAFRNQAAQYAGA